MGKEKVCTPKSPRLGETTTLDFPLGVERRLLRPFLRISCQLIFHCRCPPSLVKYKCSDSVWPMTDGKCVLDFWSSQGIPKTSPFLSVRTLVDVLTVSLSMCYQKKKREIFVYIWMKYYRQEQRVSSWKRYYCGILFSNSLVPVNLFISEGRRFITQQ